MKINFKDTFVSRLEKQLEFIALDSPANARRFKNDLLKRIGTIPSNPFKCRKSIWFDDSLSINRQAQTAVRPNISNISNVLSTGPISFQKKRTIFAE